MTLEQLKEDKEKLIKLINQTQVQLYRLDGALGYINDNIKSLEEEGKKEEDK